MEKDEVAHLLSRMSDHLNSEQNTMPLVVRSAMLSRAIQSNNDIKAGRIFGFDEALQRVKASIRRK